MVSSATSTPGTGKFSAALALREAATVSYATSTPGYRKVQRRTCVTRGNHGFLRTLEPGDRKVQRRTCVTRGSHGFVGNFDTGRPESSAPHSRYARQPWFPPHPRHRDTGKFSAALALREAATVSSATSTPGHRNMRIRDCLNSPLKEQLCSGGRVRFRGRRPWSASSSAGTWCLRPP